MLRHAASYWHGFAGRDVDSLGPYFLLLLKHRKTCCNSSGVSSGSVSRIRNTHSLLPAQDPKSAAG